MTEHALRRARYQDWLTAQSLRYGFDAEVATLAARERNGVFNDTPPLERWHHILPTVRLVERVRDQFGATTLHSAYRSLTYNLAIGGAGDSRHTHNDAIDFACAQGQPRDWAAFLHTLRDSGAFTGGIGVYGTFVHVDTRGYNADWTG